MVIDRDVGMIMDAFILTEVNINKEITTLFSIFGHDRFTFTRASGRKGRTFVIFFENIWFASQRTVTMTHAECIGLRISCKDFSVVLISINRPPSSNPNLFLEELDKALSERSPTSQLCLVGGVNINIIDSSHHSECDYLNLLATYAIESVI